VNFPPAFVSDGIDALDRAQRRVRPAAFAVAVVKRYGDDRGGMYAALITFYGLLSVFPLLLLFITIASMILGQNSAAEKSLVDSALSQFPVIGPKLASNIHVLSNGNWFAFTASFLFLAWGALGITSALQMASHRAWRLPRSEEPNLVIRTARGLLLLSVIAAAVVLTTVVAAISTSGYFGHFSPMVGLGADIGTGIVNVIAYFVALRVLAPVHAGWKTLAPGAIVGGLAWTGIQQLGGYLIHHQLQRTSEIYGFFAIVLGLIFWLNIGAQLFLIATEITVVADCHDWPRGLRDPSDEVAAERGLVEATGSSPQGT